MIIEIFTDCARFWEISEEQLRQLAASPHEKRMDLIDEFDLAPAKVSSENEANIAICVDDRYGLGFHNELDEESFQREVASLLGGQFGVR